MGSGFDYKEYVKWVNSLNIATEQFDLWLKKFLLEQAQRVVRDAKLRSPVDTGAYRASWSIGNQEVRLKETGKQTASGGNEVIIDEEHSDIASIAVVKDKLEVEIFNPMDYSTYIEYGHGSYPGQYVLTIAIEKVQNALPTRFDRQFKEFLKKRGVV